MIQFKPVAEDFADTLAALREFVASIGPVLVQRQEDLTKDFLPFARKLSTALWVTGKSPEPPNIPEDVKSGLREIKRLLEELGSLSQSAKLARPPATISKILPIKFVNGKVEVDWDVPEAVDALPAHRALDAVRKELRLLHESALMALTARSEWFIAQLFHLFLNEHPGAAGMSEPFFSLEALSSLQTIDEAREALIEHKVESLMRESLDTWLKFFKERPKLGMGYMTNEIPRMGEVFKRRNLVVHNGGRVGRRYLEEVDESLRPGIKLGEIVEITPGYLNAAIDLLEQQLLLLAAELWKNLYPQDEERGSVLTTLAVHRLNDSRWLIARGLSLFVTNDKNMKEPARLRGQINYWQSFKWAGEYDAIRTEVEGADFSAKAPLYQLAYAAIKDDFARCFELLPGLLERNELTKFDLKSWPLFKLLRERAEFSAYKDEAAENKDGDAAKDDGLNRDRPEEIIN